MEGVTDGFLVMWVGAGYAEPKSPARCDGSRCSASGGDAYGQAPGADAFFRFVSVASAATAPAQ